MTQTWKKGGTGTVFSSCLGHFKPYIQLFQKKVRAQIARHQYSDGISLVVPAEVAILVPGTCTGNIVSLYALPVASTN
jgi:hypothetical protein